MASRTAANCCAGCSLDRASTVLLLCFARTGGCPRFSRALLRGDYIVPQAWGKIIVSTTQPILLVTVVKRGVFRSHPRVSGLWFRVRVPAWCRSRGL